MIWLRRLVSDTVDSRYKRGFWGHPKGRLYQYSLLSEGHDISKVQPGPEKCSLVMLVSKSLTIAILL